MGQPGWKPVLTQPLGPDGEALCFHTQVLSKENPAEEAPVWRKTTVKTNTQRLMFRPVVYHALGRETSSLRSRSAVPSSGVRACQAQLGEGRSVTEWRGAERPSPGNPTKPREPHQAQGTGGPRRAPGDTLGWLSEQSMYFNGREAWEADAGRQGGGASPARFNSQELSKCTASPGPTRTSPNSPYAFVAETLESQNTFAYQHKQTLWSRTLWGTRQLYAPVVSALLHPRKSCQGALVTFTLRCGRLCHDTPSSTQPAPSAGATTLTPSTQLPPPSVTTTLPPPPSLLHPPCQDTPSTTQPIPTPGFHDPPSSTQPSPPPGATTLPPPLSLLHPPVPPVQSW
ncbi:unnamed protein product [Boreogadus saida]